jgi:hypothetical protein
MTNRGSPRVSWIDDGLTHSFQSTPPDGGDLYDIRAISHLLARWKTIQRVPFFSV